MGERSSRRPGYLAGGLVLMAVLLGAARLLTGVVYGGDSPVAYFVLKTAPAYLDGTWRGEWAAGRGGHRAR